MADDFTYLFPAVANDLYLKWDTFCEKIGEIYDELITDKDLMKILAIMKNSNLKKGTIIFLIVF